MSSGSSHKKTDVGEKSCRHNSRFTKRMLEIRDFFSAQYVSVHRTQSGIPHVNLVFFNQLGIFLLPYGN